MEKRLGQELDEVKEENKKKNLESSAFILAMRTAITTARIIGKIN